MVRLALKLIEFEHTRLESVVGGLLMKLENVTAKVPAVRAPVQVIHWREVLQVLIFAQGVLRLRLLTKKDTVSTRLRTGLNGQ